MKILIATTTGFHLKHLARELMANGEKVQYYSYIPRYKINKVGLTRNSVISLFYDLLPYSALALLRYLPSKIQSFYVQVMLKKTDDMIARKLKNKCDIFVGLSSMAIASAQKAKDQGAIVVIERSSIHVLSQQKILVESGGTLSANYIKRELESYKIADYITVLSKKSAVSFYERGFPKEKIFICPPGVDLKKFLPTNRPNSNQKILFVGAWGLQKGCDLLVDAVKKRSNWRVTHVGKVTDLTFPKSDPQFTTLGHCNHEKLVKLMGKHNMLVLPSRQDGFGMVLLEALASGLPVVASTMTGASDIKEIIKNKKWIEIFKSNDSLDLLNALDNMHKKELNIELNREIINSDERNLFGWKEYGNKYQKFLLNIKANEFENKKY
jgi:glycosyltransferase involved in cell wall biosynthesis